MYRRAKIHLFTLSTIKKHGKIGLPQRIRKQGKTAGHAKACFLQRESLSFTP